MQCKPLCPRAASIPCSWLCCIHHSGPPSHPAKPWTSCSLPPPFLSPPTSSHPPSISLPSTRRRIDPRSPSPAPNAYSLSTKQDAPGWGLVRKLALGQVSSLFECPSCVYLISYLLLLPKGRSLPIRLDQLTLILP